MSNASYELVYYGDYFSGDTDNWMLYIYEDTVTMNGAFIMLDFLCDPSQGVRRASLGDNGKVWRLFNSVRKNIRTYGGK